MLASKAWRQRRWRWTLAVPCPERTRDTCDHGRQGRLWKGSTKVLINPCATPGLSFLGVFFVFSTQANLVLLRPTLAGPAVSSAASPTSGQLAKACYETVISCTCSKVQNCLVIASVTERCEGSITETHKQLNHNHQTQGTKHALFPLSPSLNVSHFC